MRRNRQPAAWIAATAMGAALAAAVQYLGGLIPDIAVIFGPFSVRQLITGALVNCVLLVFTARAGLASGAVIGVLSAVLAGLLGISQLVLSPVVAAGNAILCLVYWFLEERMNHISGVIAGAVVAAALIVGAIGVTIRNERKAYLAALPDYNASTMIVGDMAGVLAEETEAEAPEDGTEAAEPEAQG